MKVRSGSTESKTICRINKSGLNMISAKRLFYYIDRKENENGEIVPVYALVDNTKGKMKITEYDSIEELEKEVKKKIK